MKELKNRLLSLSLALGVICTVSQSSYAQDAANEPSEEITLKLNCEAEAAKWFSEELQRIAQDEKMSADEKRAAREKARAIFNEWREKCQNTELHCETEAARWLAAQMVWIAQDEKLSEEEKNRYRAEALNKFLSILEECQKLRS